MLKFIKNNMHRVLNKEILYYIIFGILTTLVDMIMFYISNEVFSINYIISTIIAWILAVLFAYFTNRKWVFKSNSTNRYDILKEFVLFIIARVTSLILTIIWMIITVELLKINEFISKLLANFFVIIINYIFSSLYIFKNKK